MAMNDTISTNEVSYWYPDINESSYAEICKWLSEQFYHGEHTKYVDQSLSCCVTKNYIEAGNSWRWLTIKWYKHIEELVLTLTMHVIVANISTNVHCKMNSCFNPFWLPQFHAWLAFIISNSSNLHSSTFNYQSLNVPENGIMLFILWNVIQLMGLTHA